MKIKIKYEYSKKYLVDMLFIIFYSMFLYWAVKNIEYLILSNSDKSLFAIAS